MALFTAILLDLSDGLVFEWSEWSATAPFIKRRCTTDKSLQLQAL